MEENTAPTPPVKKQSGMGMLLMGIVIGAALLGGGYYGWTLLYPPSNTATPYAYTYTPPVATAPVTTTTTTPAPTPAASTPTPAATPSTI